MDEWELKYRALLAGLKDKTVVDAAEYLMQRALYMHQSTGLPWDYVSSALLQFVQTLVVRMAAQDMQTFVERLAEESKRHE